MAQQGRAAAGGQPDQELGPGGGDLAQEFPGVKAAVHQDQHRGIQQVQQLARPVQLADGGGAEDRADQRPGAGLHQRHQLDDRVAGLAERGVHLAQPGTVTGGIGDLDRLASVEGDGAVPAGRHTRGMRPGHRPGQHLKQRLQRRRAQPPPQIPQRPRRGHGQAQPIQGRGQLCPHSQVASPREQPQRQHEIHPRPRGQHAQPPLSGAGIRQHRIHQLERHNLG